METETYRFIALIEKHPQLYNKKHKDFLRQDIRNQIWENICKEMNWDGEFALLSFFFLCFLLLKNSKVSKSQFGMLLFLSLFTEH